MFDKSAKRGKACLVLALQLCGLAAAATICNAQTFQVGAEYQTVFTQQSVDGGLAHLPDGDILAFANDFVNGPILYRVDANDDGIPAGGTKVLRQYSASEFPGFVQVAPNGQFALAGLTGFSAGADMIYRIDLATDAVDPFMAFPGNYDLTFINDDFAYLSANPQGFNPSGPNQISLLKLTGTPQFTPVAELFGTPSGPIALNSQGDLYYIKGTFTFPSPPNSSKILRFSAGALAQAASNGTVLSEADSTAQVTLNGGYDIVFHRLSAVSGEFYITTVNQQILRMPETTLTPEVFLTAIDPNAPSFTSLSFYQPDSVFDASLPTQAELAASLATNFFSTMNLLQVRTVTYQPVERVGTDENGFCRPDETDCIHQQLQPAACVGANGFLSQINIASVINLQSIPLNVSVQYFDAAGSPKGVVNALIQPNLKSDFLVNQLGLQPDTIGTVCVITNGSTGSWTGGLALYKPDLRSGPAVFGEAFDFALYYPFQNAFQAPVTVPLNTFHLGTDPRATVANWIALIDAERNGEGLFGTLIYYDESGSAIGAEPVAVGDGSRRDFAGHIGIGGLENRDAVGMVEFIPNLQADGTRVKFYMTLTRYFYDCPGSSCNNFLTAFNLPYRPGTSEQVSGGISTTNGEISIVELNNVTAGTSTAQVRVFGETGASAGNANLSVPPRATRHLILNKFGGTGFLADDSVATASVLPQSGFVSATSLFYKLNASGQLEYAYSAPFAGSPGTAQLSQFNSFISQVNVPEVFNSGALDVDVGIDFFSYTGARIGGANFVLAPNNTRRITDLSLPKDNYGTVIIQGGVGGIVARNFVRRPGMYTLAFGGQ